jgi:glucoamylase
MEPRGNRVAFGAPGIPPRWSHSAKDGIGTSYSTDSRLWFSLWQGIITETYFPRIDRPQLRDLEFLFTDGATFFHEEKRHLERTVEPIGERALGYVVRSTAPDGRYRLEKTVLTDPHLPCLLLRCRVEVADAKLAGRLRAYLLAAPHLDGGGWGNHATVYDLFDRPVLAAEKNGVAMAVAATRPFVRASVGYVGASDGYTDVSQHRGMTFEFDRAPDGNVALTGEIALDELTEFTVGVGFGESLPAAVTTLFQSLGTPFDDHRRKFLEQWARTATHEGRITRVAYDSGRLYRTSRSVLLAHEDKTFPGAFIASLTIPWGAAKSDDDRGGYHLVWTRDMVNTAAALLASGATEAPLRALVYLATRQRPDGGFPQNFWVDGTPYWQGIQLDEVALPILLAGKMYEAKGLQEFDPYPFVRRAARYLVEQGPATQQDRWEEVGGYSPSTLAATIAGLVVAARIARARGEPTTAEFLLQYADFLESHVERWTVTERGTLDPDVRRHYVRIRPAPVPDVSPEEGPELGRVRLPNLPPGSPAEFPAAEVVDGGFLDLVRYGIRRADDPLVADSVRVVDRVLKVETPHGPVWRRYNHDGYGQRDDGGPYATWGRGRAWPLLTGERGHFELARGRDPGRYLETMERLASATGLLPEQVWDDDDRPALHLVRGGPTDAAMPLVWAHAEYVKLLRSVTDRRVFDRVAEVEVRYGTGGARRTPLAVWKFNRQPPTVDPAETLRVLADQPFRLRASRDGWSTASEQDAAAAGLGLHYVDLPPLDLAGHAWTFTFYWSGAARWEGRNYVVRARGADDPPTRP